MKEDDMCRPSVFYTCMCVSGLSMTMLCAQPGSSLILLLLALAWDKKQGGDFELIQNKLSDILM